MESVLYCGESGTGWSAFRPVGCFVGLSAVDFGHPLDPLPHIFAVSLWPGLNLILYVAAFIFIFSIFFFVVDRLWLIALIYNWFVVHCIVIHENQ